MRYPLSRTVVIVVIGICMQTLIVPSADARYTGSPKLHDDDRAFRGNLNANRQPYSRDSPNNPYGQGLEVYR